MADEFAWMYSEKVKEHFMHPRNILEDEKGYREDGKGVIGNIKCGDQMAVYIKVDASRNVVTDVKWKTYGCASAIASTSILSEMATGKTLDEACAITSKDIARELGGLPEHKIHCSVLGDKALRAAIDDYYTRRGMLDKVRSEKEHIICQCLGVTDKELEEAVLEGARTYVELQEKTKCGTVCGNCRQKTLELLEKYTKEHFGADASGKGK
jgi:nitrogen fixation protein NifU and related proteins